MNSLSENEGATLYQFSNTSPSFETYTSTNYDPISLDRCNSLNHWQLHNHDEADVMEYRTLLSEFQPYIPTNTKMMYSDIPIDVLHIE